MMRQTAGDGRERRRMMIGGERVWIYVVLLVVISCVGVWGSGAVGAERMMD
jgi:hypothetical protein